MPALSRPPGAFRAPAGRCSAARAARTLIEGDARGATPLRPLGLLPPTRAQRFALGFGRTFRVRENVRQPLAEGAVFLGVGLLQDLQDGIAPACPVKGRCAAILTRSCSLRCAGCGLRLPP